MDDLALMKDVGYVNPELARILATSGPVSSPDPNTDIYELREMLRQRRQALMAAAAGAGPAAAASSVVETDHRIPTRDGAEITLRVYRKPGPATGDGGGGGPVLVMLHGGGWVMGGLDNEAPLCRAWCDAFPGGVSVNVDYRLAPEVRFPVPVFDCYDAVQWTAAHTDVHGGNPARGFVVAGASAGASMACVAAHLAHDEHLTPPLTGVYLSIPSLLSSEAVPARWQSEYTSFHEHKDGLILNEKALMFFRQHYHDDPLSPLMSPAVWPSGHENFPPTYLQVAGKDLLRDDGLIFEKMLQEAGVATKLDPYPGLPHAFWTAWPSAEFSLKQRKDAVEGFRWLIERK